MKTRFTPKATVPLKDIVEEFDFEQRSEEWYAARIGVCTASNFSAILATGADGGDSKMRAKLLNRMAAEVIFGRPMESFSNAAMAHGLEVEPLALDHYAFTRGVEVRRVGFVRRTINRPLHGDLVIGCSPDGLAGDDGVVQVKRMQPDLIVALVDSGRFPTEHRAQCHGEIWVTGRKWADLKIFYAETDGGESRRFPISPVYRFERSEEEIVRISHAVETFDYELRQLVKRMEARKS